MKTAQELRRDISAMDHRGYPAYKSLAGSYEFDSYVLGIDHVQGDPFAAPSRLSIRVDGRKAGFPAALYASDVRRTSLEDLLLRRFRRETEKVSFRAGGSGKSGLISSSAPGQEILKRSACRVDPKTGGVLLRFDVGFPAHGRSIAAGELIRILYDYLPEAARKALFYRKEEERVFREAAELADDREAIRQELDRRGLAAFVADGSILPRESGISQKPMKNAVPFRSPESMKVTLVLPHKGELSGMGISRGITLIVGGGYHGKSTLLEALERGVYPHIAGDGREYVVTEDSAVKLRAEDGRSVRNDDISLFIDNLPGGTDCRHFSTENASGSTSQAANTLEAVEAGSRLLLIDEDTCATNFMIRDALMASVVKREDEPITPFLERIRPLYEEKGISTILVAGSSGLYFGAADRVIQMDRYRAVDITERAKAACKETCAQESGPLRMPAFDRRPKGQRFERAKIKTTGVDEFLLDRTAVFLGQVEQIADREQTAALGHCLLYLLENVFDGRKTLSEAIELLCGKLAAGGPESIISGRTVPDLALPRKQEIFACVNRYRKLKC